MKSFYLAIDGIDGSGKTTQIKKIGTYLKTLSIPHYLTKEPGGTVTGEILRRILISKEFNIEPETELLLYSADRLEHQKKIVIPYLQRGIAVISDRFISSTYAYQVFGRGLDIKTLDFLRDLSVLIYPHITIIIDIPPDKAIKRAQKKLFDEKKIDSEGKFESLGLNFYTKVREGFLWYSRNFENVIVIDGNVEEDKLFEKIKEQIDRLLYAVLV
ncbi:MAG: dTMP kinase [Calditerrivibrio sp.]|nr:dTMP kinase [Calditerrivibrio sp.]